MATSIVVKPIGGRLRPFNRDKLFVSILRAVGHRNDPLNDANALTATIIAKLLHATREASLEPVQITAMAIDTLSKFDTAACVQYQAYHK